MDRGMGKEGTGRRNFILISVCVATCLLLFVAFSSTTSVVAPVPPVEPPAPVAPMTVATAPNAAPQTAPNAPRTPPTIPTFKTRYQLGAILNRLSLTTGVELGVQRGIFSEATLRSWTRCKKYVLVDLWAHQKNYKDNANFHQVTHNIFKAEALFRVSKFRSRTNIEVCQNYTTVCAARYKSAGVQFDYIYVDARHDYKGVLQDLRAWYPLLRPGGVLAGHDYVTQNDGPRHSGQDWTVNFDGTRDTSGRVVKGAVDDFAEQHGLQLTVSYREPQWNTWATRKPY